MAHARCVDHACSSSPSLMNNVSPMSRRNHERAMFATRHGEARKEDEWLSDDGLVDVVNGCTPKNCSFDGVSVVLSIQIRCINTLTESPQPHTILLTFNIHDRFPIQTSDTHIE